MSGEKCWAKPVYLWVRWVGICEMERRSRSSDRRRRTWSYKCKEFLRQFIAFMFSNIGIIGLVVGYTIAGSFMFIALEKDSYNNRLDQVRKIRNDTADELWRRTCCDVYEEATWRNIVTVELEKFQNKIVKEVVIFGYEGERASTNRWSFSGSFLYSLSVITTIGQFYLKMVLQKCMNATIRYFFTWAKIVLKAL